MTEGDPKLRDRLLSALLRGSATIVFTSVFAVPGLLFTSFVSPEMVGYYLIAFVGASAHVGMRAIGDQPDSDTSLSPETLSSAISLLAILSVIATTVVSVRLGLGVVVAGVIENGVGQSTLTVFGAAVTPLFDYRIGDSVWWLSPSSIITIAIAKLIAVIIEESTSDPDSSETAQSLLEDTRRIDPM
ncbi:hypothetical protein [Halobaculum sp. MBLA0143]|uniref:hypothetical protein n=1 Tax=Halobaculum sp. MBLA0143 TaxID=3079933 RepID=UPI0035255EAD